MSGVTQRDLERVERRITRLQDKQRKLAEDFKEFKTLIEGLFRHSRRPN